jgi:hypothetical protein
LIDLLGKCNLRVICSLFTAILRFSVDDSKEKATPDVISSGLFGGFVVVRLAWKHFSGERHLHCSAHLDQTFACLFLAWRVANP